MGRHFMRSTIIAATLIGAHGTVSAHDTGDWIVRAGPALAEPREDSDLGLGLDSDTQLGLSASYMLNQTFAVGFLAGTPFTHDVTTGATTIAEITHLPPTLSVEYFPNVPGAALQPFLGLGVNFTWTSDEELTSAGEAAGLFDLEADNSVGLAASIGVDYRVSDRLYLNATVYRIDIEIDVEANDGAVKDTVTVNPYVYMIGLGYQF